MADSEFETQLGRWFAEAPAAPDPDGFARRVERRLDRAWRVRGALIGTAGVAGGVVAAAQMLGGGHVFQDVASASTRSVAAVSRGVTTVGGFGQLASLPAAPEVLWVGAGLAVLAVVFFAVRAIEEF